MKKIIALFVFMFALSFNANAQEGKTALELGTVDAQALAQYLEISGPIVKDLQNLFVEKHQVLLTEGISEERIKVLTEVIEHKLAATLDANEMEKLKSDQVLYKKLIKN
ncbi:hypothetical protein [uncultured Flavobacterium sp.]|uniref:hypothetical protein n=1 Tax=uncultured Flavobacterium sp. TaxID=165435 RepID=UPI0030EDA19B|tara:strand:+ start:2451 stop:2777 length:327 start_codon:yes stop_codon:yes gene_type:complete